MDSPKTAVANWKTQYEVTVTASPSGALEERLRLHILNVEPLTQMFRRPHRGRIGLMQTQQLLYPNLKNC
ncbi:MAG: hypothetical protein QXR45_13670 [Candidatus Bathyarchaeia archaeon]